MTIADEGPQKKPKPLSARQKAILEYIIKAVVVHGYPPAVREIGEAVSLRSSSTVHAHLNSLEKQGYIQRDPSKPRAIMVLRNSDGSPFNLAEEPEMEPEDASYVELPLVGKVAEGDHAFSYEDIEEKLAFSTHLVQKDAFLLKLSDDSMINAGMLSGDYIIVVPQQMAQNGEIVVVLIGNEVTCKTFYREKTSVRLQPENDEMEPLFVENPMIIGKVIGVYRDLQRV